MRPLHRRASGLSHLHGIVPWRRRAWDLSRLPGLAPLLLLVVPPLQGLLDQLWVCRLFHLQLVPFYHDLFRGYYILDLLFGFHTATTIPSIAFVLLFSSF